MKKIIFLFFFILFYSGQVFGQINPVENLLYNGWYAEGSQQFELTWKPPTPSGNSLVGYNIYRGNEFYGFQTETSLYYLINDVNNQPYYNGPLSFLQPAPFWAHVTAVYSLDVESSFIDSVFVAGYILGTKEIKPINKTFLYPNPTSGKLYIKNKEIQKITLFDLRGKLVKEFEPAPEIDISKFPAGIYFIKLISGKKTTVDKIILE